MWGESKIIVRGGAGERVTSLTLPDSGRFGVSYRHSYYEAPATEHFVAEGGDFRLRAISSPHEGVLDYYRLDGERRAHGGQVWLIPEEERAYETLPLIATERGQRTLVTSEDRRPLYVESGPRHLTITTQSGGSGRLGRAFSSLAGMLSAISEPDESPRKE